MGNPRHQDPLLTTCEESKIFLLEPIPPSLSPPTNDRELISEGWGEVQLHTYSTLQRTRGEIRERGKGGLFFLEIHTTA